MILITATINLFAVMGLAPLTGVPLPPPTALAVVDAAVAQGAADPDRLGVGGWSYGGILTDYLIASDNRFKAATSGAGTRGNAQSTDRSK